MLMYVFKQFSEERRSRQEGGESPHEEEVEVDYQNLVKNFIDDYTYIV